MESLRPYLQLGNLEDLSVCFCMGTCTLVFYPSQEWAVVHHGRTIRHGSWSWHAPLGDGRGLAEKLAQLGYDGLLKEINGS